MPLTEHPRSYPPWTEVTYSCPVGGAAKAPDQLSDWAKYVRRAVEICGAVTELRRRSGVGRTSIYRYVNDDGTRVTLDVARRIALAIDDKPENAIRAAGSLLELEDLAPIDPPADPRQFGLDPKDEVVKKIMATKVSNERKRNMLARRRKILDDRVRADLEEIEFLVDPGTEAV